MTLPDLVTHLRGGPTPGVNFMLDRRQDATVGLDFSIIRLSAGERFEWSQPDAEGALLVISGEGKLELDGRSIDFQRPSWIEKPPYVAHGCAGAQLSAQAVSECDLALVATESDASFESRLLLPEQVQAEHRGKGMWNDAAYRIVRTVFDRSSSPDAARLVLGEVVNFPGRWSSFPPHHHRQPEIYYYRFQPEHGYGHGELGDDVFKIRCHDLLRITDGRDHAQVSAPGYHMYYLWAIRHIEGDPYTGFEFNPEHRWLMDEG